MKPGSARALAGRVVAALALIFGAAGLAACGGDDGATVRNLDQEKRIEPQKSGDPQHPRDPAPAETAPGR